MAESHSFHLETLDQRLLLAVANIINGTAYLRGTNGDDAIILKQSQSNPKHFNVFGARRFPDGTLITKATRFEILTGAGNDQIEIIADDSASFSVRIDPGAGNDQVKSTRHMHTTLEYATAKTGIHVNLGKGIARDGQGGLDTIQNIRSVEGTPFDDVLINGPRSLGLNGNEGNDDIRTGRSGGTQISDGPGDDTITGSSGATIHLGSGKDIVDTTRPVSIRFEGEETGILARLDRGYLIDGHGDKDFLRGPISEITGTSFADWIVGSAADEHLVGGFGDDTIQGGGGNDALVGGEGENVLKAGAGDDQISTDFTGHDWIDGGRGIDTIELYENGGVTDTIVSDPKDDVIQFS